jgi:predicted TIM-barrel fold metal-dependent hydrolase
MDVGVTVDGADAFTLSGQIARVSFKGGLARFADDIARGFDARAQLAAMDREGIDVTVLYPSRGLFVHSIADLDPAFSEAIARAYNNWLADFCRDGDPRRMYGAAMLPIHDVAASIREARRAVRESTGITVSSTRCGRNFRSWTSRSGFTRASRHGCRPPAMIALPATSSACSTRARTAWSRCWRSRP